MTSELRIALSDRWVDVGARCVDTARGDRFDLTPREAELLRFLAAAPGHAAGVDQLLEQVWGYHKHVRTRTVVTTVHRLRRKLEPDPARPIHLVRETDGYRLAIAARPGVLGRDELLGRDDLLAAASRQQGLVTLHGPGGVGKSTIARAAFDDDDPAAIWLDVESLPLAERMWEPLARQLGVMPGSDARAACRTALDSGTFRTVVLDGCEAHLPALGQLLVSLDTPPARVLCTSRTVLGLPGEHVLVVPVLDQDSAVALLTRCADSQVAGWATGHLPQLARIADAVERLPLALELIGARALVATPRQLADCLERPPTTTTPQSLQAAMQRTWSLLTLVQRRTASALTVLGTPFDVELATAVARGVADDPEQALVDLTRSAVVQRTVTRAGSVQLSMLRPIRTIAIHNEERSGAQRRLVAFLVARCRWALRRHLALPHPHLSGQLPHLEKALDGHRMSASATQWLIVGLAAVARPFGSHALTRARLEQVRDRGVTTELRYLARAVGEWSAPTHAIRQQELKQAEVLARGDATRTALVRVRAIAYDPLPDRPDRAQHALNEAQRTGDRALVAIAERVLGNHYVRCLRAREGSRAVCAGDQHLRRAGRAQPRAEHPGQRRCRARHAGTTGARLTRPP